MICKRYHGFWEVDGHCGQRSTFRRIVALDVVSDSIRSNLIRLPCLSPCLGVSKQEAVLYERIEEDCSGNGGGRGALPLTLPLPLPLYR